ncbi:MAG: nucleoside 2-deoxyribosyltransferase [Ignavibacteria bacterium]|nr:nucleoside 2-deoxyribosyltransferase [Candidatus Gracilibacteria bacterium]
MKIYYATSIRGSAENNIKNAELISLLKKYGEVLTEHFSSMKTDGETDLSDKEIHDRDLKWIDECDVIAAEVTNPSLGVGYEIRYGIERGKRILCLKQKNGKKLSAMISGCDYVEFEMYENMDDLDEILSDFFD